LKKKPKIKNLLILNGYVVITVQDLNKRGVKNKELMELARIEKCILIICDKYQ